MAEKPYYNHDSIWEARAQQKLPTWGSYSLHFYKTVYSWLNQYSPPPKTILDVGCGAGAFGSRLTQGYDYTGVEESLSAHEWGKQKFPQLKFILADFAQKQTAPIFPEKFDIVICLNVFHCFTEKEHRLNLLENCFQNLKKEGIFILTTMCGPEPKKYRASPRPRAFLLIEKIKQEIQTFFPKIIFEQENLPNPKAPIGNYYGIFST